MLGGPDGASSSATRLPGPVQTGGPQTDRGRLSAMLGVGREIADLPVPPPPTRSQKGYKDDGTDERLHPQPGQCDQLAPARIEPPRWHGPRPDPLAATGPDRDRCRSYRRSIERQVARPGDPSFADTKSDGRNVRSSPPSPRHGQRHAFEHGLPFLPPGPRSSPTRLCKARVKVIIREGEPGEVVRSGEPRARAPHGDHHHRESDDGDQCRDARIRKDRHGCTDAGHDRGHRGDVHR